MKHYGLDIAEGSEITNTSVATGTGFPSNENSGELFYRTDETKLYVYNGTGWDEVSVGAGLITQDDNDNIIGGGNDTGSSLGGTALDNIFIGDDVASNLVNGGQNVIIGNNAVQNASSGSASQNTIIGYQAGQDVALGSTTTDNTLVGAFAGLNVNGGLRNTSIGRSSGLSITTGSDNTFLGRQAGWRFGSASSRNVVIGLDAGPSFVQTINDELWIDTTSGGTNTPLLRGYFSNNVLGPKLVINGDLEVTGSTSEATLSVTTEFNVPPLGTDPVSGNVTGIWQNTTSNEVKTNINGSTETFATQSWVNANTANNNSPFPILGNAVGSSNISIIEFQDSGTNVQATVGQSINGNNLFDIIGHENNSQIRIGTDDPSNSSCVTFSTGTGGQAASINADALTLEEEVDLRIKEAADHNSTIVAGSGYIWVRNDNPTSLVYTDDLGNDVVLATGGAAAGGGGGVTGIDETNYGEATPYLQFERDAGTYDQLIFKTDSSQSATWAVTNNGEMGGYQFGLYTTNTQLAITGGNNFVGLTARVNGNTGNRGFEFDTECFTAGAGLYEFKTSGTTKLEITPDDITASANVTVDSTHKFYATDGTSLAPPFSFVGETNTGMSLSGDAFVVGRNGGPAFTSGTGMRIDSVGKLFLQSADKTGSADGAGLDIISGDSGSTSGTGGAIALNAGVGATTGGEVQINGGDTTGTDYAGDVTIQAGTATGTGPTAGYGGDVRIYSGYGEEGLGHVRINGGGGHGSVFIGGGNNPGQAGQKVVLQGGSGPANFDGGEVQLYGGSTTLGGNADGGDITIRGGYGRGTGTDGAIRIVQSNAPGTTTDRLYNNSGDLFWNGTQLNTTGGISNVVEDTTPQLGGNLDAQSNNILNASQLVAADSEILNIKGYFDASGPGGLVLISGGASTTGTGGGTSILTGGGTSGGILTLSANNGSSANGGEVRITSGSGPTAGGDLVLNVGRDSTDGSSDGVVDIRKPSGTTAPEVRFNDAGSTGADYVGLKAPDSLTGGVTWTLPNDNAATVAGQFLTTDSSGNLSFTSDGAGSWVLISTTIPVADTNIDLTWDESVYSSVRVEIDAVQPGSDAVTFRLQLGSANGGTIYNSVSDYEGITQVWEGTGGYSALANTDFVDLAPSCSSASNETISGTIEIKGGRNSDVGAMIKSDILYINSASNLRANEVKAFTDDNVKAAIDTVRLFFASGTFASTGDIKLYGLKR